MEDREKERLEVYRIIQSIREVNKTIFHAFWNEERHLDLTAIQHLVLSVLNERPSIGLSELADIARMGCSSMSGVIDRLAKAGYVARERDEHDRRSLVLSLTPEGKDTMQKVDAMWMERILPILDIPKEQLDMVLDIHKQMIMKLTSKGMNQLEQSSNDTSR
ncbi:MarR family transcriptional regulator [Paenibacillus kribbensis]|uniref:MarR family transcriptional regulator n=1 Tax=Paenibacillus kribbensis TaxID=172713 RepID=A0A222WN67_9BACL|nr:MULTISPECIES: MarR family transcriptional regulator [Paenibacillus]ASR47181.1 MarR family transcriptional regulator [Paenibacillus kribbensis]EHS57366.1 transcriptional regulator [Paenibacillus sp. Aloe-11]MEC0235299.1 MarR family transcriptional regulator [Paenibacillus kribbensis]